MAMPADKSSWFVQVFDQAGKFISDFLFMASSSLRSSEVPPRLRETGKTKSERSWDSGGP